VFEVLAVQVKTAECVLAAAPLPDKAIVRVGALLATETLPLKLVALVGVNFTAIGAVCPAVSVKGAVSPVMVNPAPLTPTLVMLTLVFPALLSVTVCWLLLPTVTELKFTLMGLAVSAVLEATPEPVNGMVMFGKVGSLLESTTLPEAAPAALGANSTLNVVLPLAAIFIGVASPVMLKPVPVTVEELTLNVAVPVFEIFMVCELLVPTATLLKLAVLGLAASDGVGFAFEGLALV
jgi:hypothetical protein